MRFVKMHSVGNDFVILDGFDAAVRAEIPEIEFLRDSARVMCDRHFGIGADGVLVLTPPKDPATADAHMTVVNSDGSLGAMCANGLRCAAKLLIERGHVHHGAGRPVRIAIHDRVVPVTVTLNDNGQFAWAEADMGPPEIQLDKVPVDISRLDEPMRPGNPMIRAMGIPLIAVSMGNPHAIVPSSTPEADMKRLGSALENHAAFPKRTNVHFLQILAPEAAAMFSWERGVGHTLACGSGACAAIVAGNLLGVLTQEASIIMPGGVVRARYDRAKNRVFLTGTAASVYEGEWAGAPIAYVKPSVPCPAIKLPLPTLRSERLSLRAISWTDAGGLRALASVRECAQGVASIPHPYPPGEEHRVLERQTRLMAERRAAVFGITLGTTGEYVGSIGLRFETPASAEVGYMIAHPHWNKGVATEALKAVLTYAFRELKLDRVTAGHFARNPASGRVLVKGGLVRFAEEVCPCTALQAQELSIMYELTRAMYLEQNPS